MTKFEWNRPTPAIVQVDWMDSYSEHGWGRRAERLYADRSGAMCKTVGYLLEKTDDWLTLTLGLGGSDMTDSTITIPAFAIVNFNVLRENVTP